MINLIVEAHGNRYRYRREDRDGHGEIIYTSYSNAHASNVKNGKQTLYLIFDGDGYSIPDASHYLNEVMPRKKRSENTRRKAARALAQFYAFLDLMNLQQNMLTKEDINRLVVFYVNGARAKCQNQSVNNYLGTIRDYFEATNVKCEALTKMHRVNVEFVASENFSVTSVRYSYASNLPVDSRKEMQTPKYITMDQYITLVRLAQEKGDRTAVMLMHLMFRYGMRLGECLGMTLEDLVYMNIDGTSVPTIIVRNRLTDQNFQKAKWKITPQTPDDYKDKSYIDQWKKDSYAHYYLTESGNFVEAFILFIENTRKWALENKPDNYKDSEADIVDPESFREKGLDKNYYVFLNKQGRPLSGQLWGRILRRYFVEARIPIDKNLKQNNLSHQFRHGFAMMHALFMDPPTPSWVLKDMMHHKRLSSTSVYYNPTPKDELEIKTKLQNKIFDNNPELRTIIDRYIEDEKDASSDVSKRS